ISWLLHAEKNLSWDDATATAFIRGDKSSLTAKVIAPGLEWSGSVTDQFPVPVDPKYVSGQAGAGYVTAKWSNQSHLTLETKSAGKHFSIYAVLWPTHASSRPAPLKAALNRDTLLISTPDGKTDILTLTDDSLKLQ